MPFAQINGIGLYYESHGDGDPLVFVHGGGGNHLSWWQQVPYFREHFRCITYDQRGFGASRDSENPPGLDANPIDLHALLDSLAIEKAYLVAQSLGGRSCMGFLAACPDRVKALVMCSTTLGIRDDELADRMRVRRSFPFLPEGFVPSGYSPLLKDQNPALAFLYDSISAMNPPRRSSAPGPRPGLLDPKEPYAATREKLNTIDVPVLFIAGSDDRLFPPEILEFAAKLVPGCRVEVVQGAGHSPYFEKASEFNRVLSSFLGTVP